MTTKNFAASTLALMLLLGLYGCNSPTSTPAPAAPAEESHDDADHEDGDHEGHDHDDGDHDDHDHGDGDHDHDDGDHDHDDHADHDHGDGDHDHDDHADHDHGDGDHDHDDHADHDHGDQKDDAKLTDMEKMTKNLVSFTPEERESAMKQHFCPVSGEMLGTMGAPEKVDVNGQAVWICCDGCKEKLAADPDKYLAKLKK